MSEQMRQRALGVLNGAIELDADLITKLVETRFEASEGIVRHPDIVVLVTDGKMELGVLGLINGILGSEYRIAAVFDDGGKITEFKPL